MSIEHCTLDDVSSVDEADRAYMTEYLEDFLKPVLGEEEVLCPSCRKCVYSGKMFGLATFTWGLVHGEGLCNECGWTFRMYHFLKLHGGEKCWVFPLAHRRTHSVTGEEVEP